MRFLIHANAPTVPTGYGVQTGLLADRLAADGHDVAVSCTYGQQGPVGNWLSPSGHKIRLYPQGYETNSPDVLVGHAEHWFDGDLSSGWIILQVDMWSFERPELMRTLREQFQVIAWAPVDHWPIPGGVLRFVQGAGARPVAMSQFGQSEFNRHGALADYVPLAVDTTVYRPTFEVQVGGENVSSRALFGLPLNAFVVGMVAMNKGWSRDRKGFAEAFQGFARFHQKHPDSVLFVHSEKHGVLDGINLIELAAYCAIPPDRIVFSDQYAYRIGLPSDMMAAAYTSMDVLLAPSHGEGFCVPLIEAQACGVPVIASDFTAQSELVGAGWKVHGQLEWDPAQHAWYQTPFVQEITDRLEDAYRADLPGMSDRAVEFAARYDADRVFAGYWRPLVASLEPAPPVEREPFHTIHVIVPFMRPENTERLVRSFRSTLPAEQGEMLMVHDWGNVPPVVDGEGHHCVSTGSASTTYAEKVNVAFEYTGSADAVLIVGDDCEFLPGWYEALVEASKHGDVIGTNDSEPGRIRNPEVAAGRHADHFAIRRSYIDDEGSSLDGPGVAMPTAYRHWYTDKEVIELAKARGVFVMAPECRIVHHHPGYDGDEDARRADPVYMAAVENEAADKRTWAQRAPLIAGHRAGVAA